MNKYNGISTYKKRIQRNKNYIHQDNNIIKKNNKLKSLNETMYHSFPKFYPLTKSLRFCIFKYTNNQDITYRIGTKNKNNINSINHKYGKYFYISTYAPLSMITNPKSNTSKYKYFIEKEKSFNDTNPIISLFKPTNYFEFPLLFTSPTDIDNTYYAKDIYISGDESKASTKNAIHFYSQRNNLTNVNKSYKDIKKYDHILREKKTNYLNICNFQIFYYLFIVLLTISSIGYVKYLCKMHSNKNNHNKYLSEFPHYFSKEIIDSYVLKLIPLLIAVMGGILTIYLNGKSDKHFSWIIQIVIPIISSIQFTRILNKLYKIIIKMN